jgi:hyperosmotically inducible protein
MKFKILGMLAATMVAFAGPAFAESKSVGEHVDDGAITADVKAHLLDAKGVPSGDVNVEVYKGVVLLSGFVTDNAAKAGAETAAKEAKGVVKVHNAITVHPKTSFGSKIDDTALVAKVKAALIDASDVDGGAINCEARDSIVQLGGFVSGKGAKDRALAVAKGVKGVKRVDDALYIKP